MASEKIYWIVETDNRLPWPNEVTPQKKCNNFYPQTAKIFMFYNAAD